MSEQVDKEAQAEVEAAAEVSAYVARFAAGPKVEIEGKERPLHEAVQLANLRDMQDAVRHRAVYEKCNADVLTVIERNSQLLARSVAASERSANAMERIADIMEARAHAQVLTKSVDVERPD